MTQTGVVSRISQTSPVLQSPSTAHGFGAKSVEQPTTSTVQKIHLMRSLWREQNVGFKGAQGPHRHHPRALLQKRLNQIATTLQARTLESANRRCVWRYLPRHIVDFATSCEVSVSVRMRALRRDLFLSFVKDRKSTRLNS